LADGAQEIQNFAETADTTFADLLGGTTDQVLAKNSNTNMDFKWVTPTSAVPAFPYQSLDYYPPVAEDSTNVTAGSNTAWYLPIFITENANFDRIACQTSSAHTGTSVVRMAIYNMGAGVPTTLVLDAGTVSCTAASTLYSITINQTLNQGWYWLASAVQSSTGTRGFIGCADPVGNDFLNVISGVPRAGTTSIYGANRMYRNETVAGAFPATATSAETQFMTNVQMVSLRKS